MSTDRAQSETPAGARFWLIAVVALAVIVRILWWHFGAHIIEGEGAHYARVGESLAAGQGYLGLDGEAQLVYPPVYPGLIAAGVRIGLDSESAGRLVSLACGSLAMLMFALIGRRMYGARIGLLVGLLAAVHPLLATASINVLSESTYLFFVLWGIYLWQGLLTSITWQRSVGCGVVFGFAYLCRPEAFFLTLALAVLLVLLAWWRDRRAALLAGACIVAGLVVCAVPYVTFLHAQTGQWRLEAKSPESVMFRRGSEANKSNGEIFWGVDSELNGNGISTSSDKMHVQLPPATFKERLKWSYWQSLTNLPEFERGLQHPQFGGFLMSVLIALGLFATPWSVSRWKQELPILLVLGLACTAYLIWPFIRDRTLFMIIAPGVIWAGSGLAYFVAWARSTAEAVLRRPRLANVTAAALAAVAVAFLFSSGLTGVSSSNEMSEPWSSDPVQRAVGEWLAATSPRARIADVSPIVTYYAAGTIVRLPWTDGETARRYLEKNKVEFVTMQEADLQRRPYLSEWYKQPSSSHLELVKTFPSSRGEIRVFRLKGSGTG
jgi:4-amino-4-deoxy-L-arabinose transferase-like glycosyltransferase